VSLPDLVTLGEAFEDLIFLDLVRLPRPGEELKTSALVRTIGGGATITAVAAARLGLSCHVVSGLSDLAAARLAAEGVRVSNLRHPDEPHAVTAALSTPTNRSFVTFNGVNDALEGRLLDALPDVRARHVHLAFYPRACARWRSELERLRARGITTSWDFGWNEGLLGDRSFPRLIAALDYLFLNEQEASLYARRRTLAAALAIWRRAGPEVIVKLGPRGSRWISGARDVHVPASRAKVVDTTGAGDAFNGGFLVARLRGQSPRTCLRVGNIVGALSTRAAGGFDGLPGPDEVRTLTKSC